MGYIEAERLTLQEETVKIQAGNLEFQKERLEGMMGTQQEMIRVQEKNLEFQRERFKEDKQWQLEQVKKRRREQLEDMEKQRQNALGMAEYNRMLDQWPLRISHRFILDTHRGTGPVPLRILLSIPREGPQALEGKISVDLRRFLDKHYNSQSPLRPVELLDGGWKDQRFQGGASIHILHQILKSEPVLVLETHFEEDSRYINFSAAYWAPLEEKYRFETIGKLEWERMVQDSARERARAWREKRKELIGAGVAVESVDDYGGNNVHNLKILEEEELLRAKGINVNSLPENERLTYKTSREDHAHLHKTLVQWHCAIASFMADTYHLRYNDTPLLFPNLLPELLSERIPQDLIDEMVSRYEQIYDELAKQRPFWEPELRLDFARALVHLQDKSLATQKASASLISWLRLHGVTVENDQDIDGLLKAMELVAGPEDLPYLDKLLGYLACTGDEAHTARVNEWKANISATVLAAPEDGQNRNLLPIISTPPDAVQISGVVIRVVKSGAADYRSIDEATQQARANSVIRVGPGIYNESLVIDKPLEIIGDGPAKRIVIEATGDECISMEADRAAVRGLTLRGGAGGKSNAVKCGKGELILEDCDISNDSLSCVAIYSASSKSILRRCRIDGSRGGYGVSVSDYGQGTIEDCHIFGNAHAGVEIREAGVAVMEGCKIRDGKQVGILVHSKGQGTIKDCYIFGNALAGVEIRKAGVAVLERCRINHNSRVGIYCHGEGAATVKDCDLTQNAEGAWYRGADTLPLKFADTTPTRFGAIAEILRKFKAKSHVYVFPRIPPQWEKDAKMEHNIPGSERVVGIIGYVFLGMRVPLIVFGKDDLYFQPPGFRLRASCKYAKLQPSRFRVETGLEGHRLHINDQESFNYENTSVSGAELKWILGRIWGLL